MRCRLWETVSRWKTFGNVITLSRAPRNEWLLCTGRDSSLYRWKDCFSSS